MRLKDNNNPFIHVNPPYQLMVIHSSKLVYPRELYQRGVERKRVELIAAHFNEYVANEPKVSFRNGQFIVTDGQHTIEGRILRNGGKDLPILCKVYTGMTVEQEALQLIVKAWDGKPDSFRASVLRGMMHFVELYHGEFSEERLLRALRNIHPVDIYRIGQDDPAKLRGWKKYVFPIYTAYNGKCRKDALPMKF